MRRTKRSLLILTGVAAVVALVLAGAAGPWAGDRDDDVVRNIFVVRDVEFHGSRGFLGVGVEEETERSDGGARVQHVVEGSPAEEAGVQAGDIVVEINGTSIYGPRGLTKSIHSLEPGDTANIEIVRDGRQLSLSVTLGERSGRSSFQWKGRGDGEHVFEWNHEQFENQMEQLHDQLGNRHFSVRIGGRPKLGVQLIDTTPELREHLGGSADAGVLVAKVIEGTPAEEFGLQVGDLIESVDGETIGGSHDLIRALRDADGQRISIGVIRDGRPQTIDVSIPEPEQRELRRSGPKA